MGGCQLPKHRKRGFKTSEVSEGDRHQELSYHKADRHDLTLLPSYACVLVFSEKSGTVFASELGTASKMV